MELLNELETGRPVVVTIGDLCWVAIYMGTNGAEYYFYDGAGITGMSTFRVWYLKQHPEICFSIDLDGEDDIETVAKLTREIMKMRGGEQ